MPEEHHVKIILEAISKGSSNIRNFFAAGDNEIKRFRKSVKEAQKEVETFAGFGDTTTGRGPGGRFVALKKDIDEGTNSLRHFREEFRKTLSERGVGELFGGFRAGLSEERRIREEVNKQMTLTEQERQHKLERLSIIIHKRKLKRINDLEDAEVGEIRKVIAAEEGRAISDTRVERSRGRVIQLQINLLEKLQAEKKLLSKEERTAATNNLKDLFEERDEIDRTIRLRNAARDSFVQNERRKIAALHTSVREELNIRERELKRRITRPTVVAVEQQVRSRLSQDIDKDSNSFRKLGVTAARTFGQFRSGLRIARNGLSDFEKVQLKAASGAERFGAHLGNAVRPAGAFRTRIILLIAALQIFGTLVVQAGAALVALASSAILAAGALGGALLAGMTQLLPIAGLLAAAFSRLGVVLDAVNLADKLQLTKGQDQKTRLDGIKQATDRLADSRYALLKAGEAVKDSEFDLNEAMEGVKDAIQNQNKAVKELADARRQAARDIVDANLEEKEAALALKEAELGVLDAKRRLREEQERSQLNEASISDAQAQLKEAQERLTQARAEGDTNEITVALQQLSIAEQSLQQIKAQAEDTQNDIARAQIDIKQADLNQRQAIIRNKRAQEDAATSRKQGVEGSAGVVSARENLVQATRAIAQAQRQQVLATRALRDSVHSLAVAKREERDAEIGLTDSRKKATAQQEQLQQALGDLSPAERKLFKSIQRIKDIYKTNFRPITDIIIESFSGAIDTVSVLFKDPKIISGAKELATAIAGSVGKLAKFAVSPEFRKFLEFSLKEAAKNVPKITDGFIDLARVLIRVARAATPIFDKLIDRFVAFLDRLEVRTRNPAGLNRFFSTAGRHLDSWIRFARAVGEILGLVIKFSAPAGKGILDDFTEKLNEWSDWLRENKEEVKTFFANVRVQIGALASALAAMAVILFKAFSSDSASQLTILLLETVIPAFALFLQMLGAIAAILNAVFNIPVIGPLTQDIVKFGIALLIVTKFIATILVPVRRLTDAFKALNIAVESGKLGTRLGVYYLNLKKAIQGVTLAQIRLNLAMLASPPVLIAAAIIALIAALVILELKFHFIERSLDSLVGGFKKVADFFTTHWKTFVLAAILAPFAPFLAGGVLLIRFRDNILGAARGVISFFKTNWANVLAGIILGPFSLARLLVIKRFGDDVIRFMRNVVVSLTGFFRELPNNIARNFTRIPEIFRELVRDAYDFGRDLIQGVIDGVKSVAFDLKDSIIGIIKGALGFVADALGIHSRSQYAYDLIGKPVGEGLFPEESDIRGQGFLLGDRISAALRDAQARSNSAKNNFLRSFDDLQSLVNQQIDLRLNIQTPEDKRLAAFDAAETNRQRQEQIQSASGNVKQARAQVTSTNKEVIKAQKALTKANTAEEKQRAREALQVAKQAHNDALNQLKVSLKEEADTRERISREEQRDALQRDADRARERLEKSVAAEHKRADKMFIALKTALNNQNWKSVQNIFNRIFSLEGLENLGKKQANAIIDGILKQAKARQGDVDKGFAAQQKTAQLKAQQEVAAGNILAETGQAGQRTVAGLKRQGLSDAESLDFLINNGLIDLPLALELIRKMNKDDALSTLGLTLKNLGNTVADFPTLWKGTKGPKDMLAKFLRRFKGDDELDAFAKAIQSLQIFEEGGIVTPGRKSYGTSQTGQAVPAIVHVGEWVLNKAQQAKISQGLGMSLEQIKMWLFGTNMGQGKPGPQTTGTKPTTKEQGFRGSFFNLVPQIDPDGVVVWFIEMDDGAFGQVSPRDAKKIKASGGDWIPGYVKRSTHGYTKKFLPPQLGRGLAEGGVVQKFLKGGVVMPGFAGPMLQSFAEGGTVLQQSSFESPSSITSSSKIEQNFNVTTQGETDWNYVLRLGAMHAQGSYT